MTDFFISKLPSGHAVKDITKAAAVASLRGDTIVQTTIATTVPLLRQQCAAVVWLRSDVCTADNLEKLAPADRAYLLKLCGLLSGGSNKAQAWRILDHLKLHPGDGGSSSGGGGGGPAASGGPSSSGGPPSSGNSVGGGSGSGGAGSLPVVLLSPAAAAALHLLARADLARLLDEAGVPYDAGETISTLRDKCSVAAWAAEQLRAPLDVRALPDPVPSRIMDALGIPTAWKPEPQDRALDGILRGCRDSSWARDPASAHGIVCPQRSALFRAVEAVALPSSGGCFARPDQLLSADETARVSALLSTKGLSMSDIQSKDGRWAVVTKDHGAAAPPAGGGSPHHPEQLKDLERQLRTLHLDPTTWLTAEERKEHAAVAARVKAVGSGGSRKRKEAFPGDEAATSDDTSLDPFAEWPWEQSLLVHTADSYTMLGRRLRHALTWSNRHFTDRLTILSREQQEQAQRRIFDSFVSAVESKRPERALLWASHAVEEAKSVMETIVSHCAQVAAVYPGSRMLVHIASRRQVQSAELKVFLADLSRRITDTTKRESNDESAATAHATAAWFDFLDGWMGNIEKELVRPATLRQAIGSASPPAPATTQPAQYGGPASGTGPQALPNKRAAVGNTPGGGGGGGPGGATPTPVSSVVTRAKMCVFQRNFPCSASIIGSTLGLSAAPPCRLCGLSAHFHGECPKEWGRIGKVMPGFAADGTRVPSMWHSKTNEPIQSTVRAWVKFLSDSSNFVIPKPLPAEVAGAPTLADFQARVAAAPAKP
uniref:Uncharacterized protein n=1 Tax=Cryptomonas curvata TaxID=233186 RepID=A0A6T7VNR6_9CRYP|mmetsp:Transcript_16767/g.35420  ORF Transcript_16767/g.35420 Transcript_16767/m.35420 type:complete len:770 (+) Transcript_16767:3501-5810(+)